MLKDVICLLADTGRSRAYLDVMARHNLLPAAAVLVSVPLTVQSPVEPWPCKLFDNLTSTAKKLEQLGIPTVPVEAANINDESVIQAVSALPQRYVVFSGPAGAILGKSFFALEKEYIHVHPGRLPAYRGSTPMYYSILKENKLAASAIFLAPEIDTGYMLNERNFPIPNDKTIMDKEYDPWMRAETLADTLLNYRQTGQFGAAVQSEHSAETFYVIHPVLRHLAIMQK